MIVKTKYKPTVKCRYDHFNFLFLELYYRYNRCFHDEYRPWIDNSYYNREKHVYSWRYGEVFSWIDRRLEYGDVDDYNNDYNTGYSNFHLSIRDNPAYPRDEIDKEHHYLKRFER